MNIDAYLTRRPRGENCWQAVQMIWLDLTGVDLGDRTPERIAKEALLSRFDTDVPGFEQQSGPVDPSIVLMRSPGVVPHVGVFMRGKVLQLAGGRYSFRPVEEATTGWDKVGFYR
jgi:hypothetical protein